MESDPLPRWLAWEWQDNAILQANPFSYQLTRLPRMELWFGIGLKPGFVLGWAGTNQFPILKPAPGSDIYQLLLVPRKNIVVSRNYR